MSVRSLKRSLTFSVTGALLLSAAACGNDNVRDDEKPVGQPLAPDQGSNTLPEEQPDGQIRPISNPAPVAPPPTEEPPADGAAGDGGTAKNDGAEAEDGAPTARQDLYINTRPADVNDAPAEP